MCTQAPRKLFLFEIKSPQFISPCILCSCWEMNPVPLRCFLFCFALQTVRWHIELQPWASPTPSLNYEALRFLKYISTSQVGFSFHLENSLPGTGCSLSDKELTSHQTCFKTALFLKLLYLTVTVNMNVKVKTQGRKNVLVPYFLFPDAFVSWQEYDMAEIPDMVVLSHSHSLSHSLWHRKI